MSALRLLLIDDHALFRGGLRMLLRDLEADLDVCEAGTVSEALDRQGTSFDLILLDLHLPGLHGEDAIAGMRQAFPTASLVVMSAEESPATIRSTIDKGASGFVPKSSTPSVMLGALKLVLAKGVYLPPQVLSGQLGFSHHSHEALRQEPATLGHGGHNGHHIGHSAGHHNGHATLSHPGHAPSHDTHVYPPAHADAPSRPDLSERQWQVLKLALRGVPNKVIARELDISQGTVKSHLTTVFRVLGVRNRTEALYAVANRGFALQ